MMPISFLPIAFVFSRLIERPNVKDAVSADTQYADSAASQGSYCCQIRTCRCCIWLVRAGQSIRLFRFHAFPTR